MGYGPRQAAEVVGRVVGKADFAHVGTMDFAHVGKLHDAVRAVVTAALTALEGHRQSAAATPGADP